MVGLMVIFWFGLYFLVLLLVTWLFWRSVKRKGWGRRGRILMGLVGFLLVFLPMFWDWLPTKIMYDHYCKTQAGVFQYKTLEQWRAENPGVELLKPYTKAEQREIYLKGLRPKAMIYGKEKEASVVRNERVSTYWHIEKLFLSIKVIGLVLVDERTKEILAEEIDFGAGGAPIYANGSNVKLWINYRKCPRDDLNKNNTIDFYKLINEFSNQSTE